MKLATLILLLPSIAHADLVEDPATQAAARLIAEADALTAQSKHDEACKKLEAALAFAPSDDARVKLSACYAAVIPPALAAKPDAAVCERVESTTKTRPSEGITVALATCYKAHAIALLDLKNTARACELAERASGVLPSPSNLAFAGGCYVDLKRLGRAWSLLVAAYDKAVATGDKVVQAQITEGAATLAPARLIVTLPATATASLDGVAIPSIGLSIAGAPTSKDSLGTSGLAVDAGKHALVVTLGDKKLERELAMVDGKLETVTAEFTADVIVKPPPPILPRRSQRKLVGWITIGTSTAVGLAGMYFGYTALSKQGDADDLCPGGTSCSREAIDLNDQAGRAANISNVLLGTALVGAAVGTYLVLTAPKETRVSVSATPSGGGVVLLRRF